MSRQSRHVADGSDNSYPGNVLGDMPKRYLSGNFPTRLRFQLEYLEQALKALQGEGIDPTDAYLAKTAASLAGDLSAMLGPLVAIWHLVEDCAVETTSPVVCYDGPSG